MPNIYNVLCISGGVYFICSTVISSFFSSCLPITETGITIGITDDNDANMQRSAEVSKCIESALACYTNFAGTGRILHISNHFITSSRELIGANPLTRSLKLLQGSHLRLILLHPNQLPLSHPIKLYKYIHCKKININKKI
jgi:hypothetical protein